MDSNPRENESQAPEPHPVDAVHAAHGSQEIDGVPAEAAAEDAAQLRSQLEEAQRRELMAHAELENFRKRMRRDVEEERRYAAMPLITDLLGVLDNLSRAIEAAEKDEGATGLLEGVKLVADQMQTVLGQHHCEEIAAEGQPFDPHLHEALAPQPSAEVPPGMVLQVVRPGYKLHERVVRPTQVLVSAGPPAG